MLLQLRCRAAPARLAAPLQRCRFRPRCRPAESRCASPRCHTTRSRYLCCRRTGPRKSLVAAVPPRPQRVCGCTNHHDHNFAARHHARGSHVAEPPLPKRRPAIPRGADFCTPEENFQHLHKTKTAVHMIATQCNQIEDVERRAQHIHGRGTRHCVTRQRLKRSHRRLRHTTALPWSNAQPRYHATVTKSN